MRNARMTICLVVVMSICMCALPAFGLIQFKDGGTHDITTTINDDIWVDWEAPGMETTVNIFDGGAISGYDFNAYNDSHISVSGGSIYNLSAYDNSQISVSGGSIGERLYVYDNSQISISGGLIHDLDADDGYVDISGGHIHTVGGRYAKINFLGGTIGSTSFTSNSEINFSGSIVETTLNIRANNKINISGGAIYENLKMWDESQAVLTGGLIGSDLIAVEASLITIYGTGFNYELGQITAPVGTLTGTLLNGDPINNSFFIYDNANIVLVPEPATLFLLGLGAVMVRKKRL